MCRKGISSSALPYKRTPPSCLKISSQDVSCRCYFKVFCLRFDDFCMWFCLLGDATNVILNFRIFVMLLLFYGNIRSSHIGDATIVYGNVKS